MADRGGRAAGVQEAGGCGCADKRSRREDSGEGQSSFLLFGVVQHPLGEECGEERIYSRVGGDDSEAGERGGGVEPGWAMKSRETACRGICL